MNIPTAAAAMTLAVSELSFAGLSDAAASDGASMVNDQGPDDYETNPAGAAGRRIVSGVIGRSSARSD